MTSLALAATGTTQGWTPSTAGPPARREAAIAEVLLAGPSSAVMFGGTSGVVPLRDTWLLTATPNGHTWTLASTPPPNPAARFRHSMAGGLAPSTAVLFGGWSPTSGFFGDTWSFNGSRWSQVSVQGPSARAFAAMASDVTAASGQLLFGGGDAVALFNDTWRFNGTWSSVITTNAPSPRVRHCMAADSRNRVIVLFGGETFVGTLLGDTWVFNGTDWLAINTPVSPAPRCSASMAYDLDRSRGVLFGGAAGPLTNRVFLNDTWEWRVRVDSSGAFLGLDWVPRAGANPPAVRRSATMAFDFFLHRMVLFGGDTSPTNLTPFGDCFTYSQTPTLVQVGASCSAPFSPTLVPVPGSGNLGSSLDLQVQNLPPSGLGFLGFEPGGSVLGVQLPGTSCTAHLLNPELIPFSHASSTFTHTFDIPFDPILDGAVFMIQAASLQPVNLSGVVTSDALQVTIR